jgi:hypothetical protein
LGNVIGICCGKISAPPAFQKQRRKEKKRRKRIHKIINVKLAIFPEFKVAEVPFIDTVIVEDSGF